MALGLVAAVLAAAAYECGYVLQALEARSAPREDVLRPSLLVYLAARRRWLAGTALSIVGAGLQVLALAHAPVTLVQPVLALGLVGLLLLAHEVLGEPIGRLEISGAASVIAGVVVVGVESPGRSSEVTSVLALVLLAGAMALIAVLPFLLRSRIPLWVAAAGAAAGDGLAAIALKLTADAASASKLGFVVLAVAGAGIAGALALTAEMSALRGLPASRVAPVVVSAQVIIPALAAVLAFGEPLTAAVLVGVLLAALGAGILGASGAVADLRGGGAGAEALAHHGRGAGERGKVGES
jgi:drug/metabolite transporter (DMT)-like permease